MYFAYVNMHLCIHPKGKPLELIWGWQDLKSVSASQFMDQSSSGRNGNLGSKHQLIFPKMNKLLLTGRYQPHFVFRVLFFFFPFYGQENRFSSFKKDFADSPWSSCSESDTEHVADLGPDLILDDDLISHWLSNMWYLTQAQYFRDPAVDLVSSEEAFAFQSNSYLKNIPTVFCRMLTTLT